MASHSWRAEVMRMHEGQQERPEQPATIPANARTVFCRMCNGHVPADKARDHIKSCWHVELRADEPIPAMTTRAEVLRWIVKRRGLVLPSTRQGSVALG